MKKNFSVRLDGRPVVVKTILVVDDEVEILSLVKKIGASGIRVG
jgi:hypothetical protein